MKNRKGQKMNGHEVGMFSKLYADVIGYLWLLVIAVWGGTANYITRTRNNKTPFSFVELLGEWSISGFAGIITAVICAEMELSFYMTTAAAGIAGHMGGRAVYMLEYYFLRKTGMTPPKDQSKK